MVYVVAVIVWVIDQGLKWVVRTHMVQGQMIPVLPPAFYFDYIRNPGAAFGLLPNARWLLVLVALVVIAAVVYVRQKWRPGPLVQTGLALVLGGAIGNLTDRVVWGTVVDYVYFKPINFPVFNFSDVCIDVGVALLLIWAFTSDRKGQKNAPTETRDATGEADQ